jgi:hypothetical protein
VNAEERLQDFVNVIDKFEHEKEASVCILSKPFVEETRNAIRELLDRQAWLVELVKQYPHWTSVFGSWCRLCGNHLDMAGKHKPAHPCLRARFEQWQKEQGK